MNKNISRDFAQIYDTYSRQNHWTSPDTLFNLCKEFLNTHQILLDIGIGTGLSAIPFKKAGLKIYGLDNSEHMLEICGSKNIADELRLHDLNILPIPYSDQKFDTIIANGVFHLTGYIESLFNDINRLLKPNGIFAFTVDIYKPNDSIDYSSTGVKGIWQKINKEHNFVTFKHSVHYIEELLAAFNFYYVKELDFCAFKSLAENREVFFRIYISRKN